MYIRCAGCGKTTRVWPAKLEQGVNCISCGRHALLVRAHQLGPTSEARFRRARKFARDQGIDLASAYSVLLGIMPMEQALTIPVDDRYDPGFEDSIDEGFMTVQQAIERGDRVLYASTLQRRHGLPTQVAFLVTDHRMLLAEALALLSEEASRAALDRHGTRGVWGIVQVAVTVVIVGAGLFAILRSKERPAALAHEVAAAVKRLRAPHATSAETTRPPAKPPEAVAFRTDTEGRVTEVSGPDPKTVLLGLCHHVQFVRTLSPIAVTSAVPPTPGDRLGFVRDTSDLSIERCVSIHRDSRTGRWFAGDGRGPLEIQRAPTLPPGTTMTPL